MYLVLVTCLHVQGIHRIGVGGRQHLKVLNVYGSYGIVQGLGFEIGFEVGRESCFAPLVGQVDGLGREMVNGCLQVDDIDAAFGVDASINLESNVGVVNT